MADGQLTLMRITLARCTGDAKFMFTGIFSGPDGADILVPLRDEDILDYHTFQKTVLNQTGWLFRLLACEGRDAATANENWRTSVCCILDRPGNAIPAGAGELN